jgi:ABC-2 type transport system permease protein
MNLRRASAVTLRQFYLIKGSFARVFPLFAWVAIDIVLWGFITKYLNTVTAYNFVPALLGAVLFWDFTTRVMQGVTMAFFEDVWSRNFLNIFATPMTTGDYLTGLVISSICTSLVGLVVMLIVATFAFGLSMLSYGIVLIPFVLILFLFGIALGITGAAFVLRLGPAAEWFIWPIPAVVSPFAGVFYPIATLPVWMRFISRLLPPSYVFEGMRSIVAGQTVPLDALLLGAALAAVYIVLAWLFFSRVYRYAVRTGLIARYSAETVA